MALGSCCLFQSFYMKIKVQQYVWYDMCEWLNLSLIYEPRWTRIALCSGGLYVQYSEVCLLWLRPVFQTQCHCCPPCWVTLDLRLHNCCFQETAVVTAAMLCKYKWHFISFRHYIGASNFIADCSEYPVTHPRTHTRTATMRESAALILADLSWIVSPVRGFDW